MPHLDHSPTPEEPHDPIAERHNARLGLVLFTVYLVAYTAFVVVIAVVPDWMGIPVGRLNLALVSGLGLILSAVALAVLYAFLCRRPAGGNS